MRCRLFSWLCAGAVVTACDRVTAPHALELADNAERTLWQNWTPRSLGSAHDHADALHAWLTSRDRSGIVLSMDGATDSIGAVVVERVYVPPDGHGMPFARRSLVAFPQNTSYGILALTEDNSDDRRGLDAYEGADQLNPHPVLAVAHSRMEDWWIPRAGHVAIEPIETGASCPFALDDNTATDSGRVSCRLATFNVQLNGELVRRLDAENSLLPETLKQHHRLDVAPQRVKGIRFTIRCPKDVMSALDKSSWYGLACYGPFGFWRNNSLFARSLDVDVTQMQRQTLPGSSHTYYRTVRAGSARSTDGAHLVRWTMSYPDGGVIARDSTTSLSELSTSAYPYWLVQDCTRGMLPGERRQCLGDLGYDPKGRLRYRIAVLDIEDVARGP